MPFPLFKLQRGLYIPLQYIDGGTRRYISIRTSLIDIKNPLHGSRAVYLRLFGLFEHHKDGNNF